MNCRNHKAECKKDIRVIRLGASTLWGLSLKVITLVGNFVLGVIIARTLGVYGKGAYALVQQLVGILVVVLGFGLGTANVYFVASKRITLSDAVANNTYLAALVSLIAAIVLFLFVSGPAAPKVSYSLAITAAALLLFSGSLLFAWHNAAAIGKDGLRPQAIAGISSIFFSLLGIVILAYSGILSTLYILLVGATAQFLAVFILWLLERKHLHHLKPNITAGKLMLHYSAKSYLIDLMSYFHLRQDILLLGWLGTASQVGIYSIAVSFAEIARSIPIIIGNASFIQASKDASQTDNADFMARLSRIATLACLLLGALFALVIPAALPLIYGAAYNPAIPVFLMLLPGTILMSMSEIPASYLFSQAKLFWRTSAVMTVVNIILNFILIPRAGITGVAIASSVTYCCYSIAIITYMKCGTGVSFKRLLLCTPADIAFLLKAIKGRSA